MQNTFVRKNKKAVSPVIGTILMVAITVVLAAVLYVMVSGIGNQPSTNNPTIVLQSQSWNAGNLPVNVQSATGSAVNPSDLTFIVADRNGTTCYTGAANLNLSTCGAAVNVVYQDNIDVGKTGAGDTIKISVYPTTSQVVSSGKVRVFYQNNEIGATTLP